MRSVVLGMVVLASMLSAVGCERGPAIVNRTDTGVDTGSVEAEALTVAAAGTSYGECGGACVSTLSIDQGALHYDLTGYDSDVYANNDGLLTELGAGQLAEMEAKLAARIELQETYGCPDCDDGGAAWATLQTADGASTTHTWEAGNAPEEFLELSLMVNDLVTALRECEASSHVTVHSSCVAYLPGS